MDSLALSIGKETLAASVSLCAIYGFYYAIGARQKRYLADLLKPLSEKLYGIENARTRDSDRVNSQLQELRRDMAEGDRAVRDDSSAARLAIRSETADYMKVLREDSKVLREELSEVRALLVRVLEHRTRAGDQ